MLALLSQCQIRQQQLMAEQRAAEGGGGEAAEAEEGARQPSRPCTRF